MYWSYHDFEVPYGFGGAIMASSAGSADINDCTFRDNFAGTGAAVSAVNLDLTVTNSTISMTADQWGEFQLEADHLDVVDATLLTCDSRPEDDDAGGDDRFRLTLVWTLANS